MPSIESTLLNAVGPQVGYGMPFSAGPYSDVYGYTGGSSAAQDKYWQALERGYDNQQAQLTRDAFGSVSQYGSGPSGSGRVFDLGEAVTYDPATGKYSFDINKVPKELREGPEGDRGLQQRYESELNDTNEDRVQARQQLEALAQKRAAQAARTEQMGAERAGFQRELARYQSPDLMRQMVNPAIQQAGNQVMANANAAGMAGGSMGQAANRRAAMMGFGQGAANVVPGAAVQQASQNFEWQKAREGMINNYYQMQNQRASTDTQNAMAQAGFQKAMEEYEHGRSMEALNAAGGFVQNFGAAAGAVAPAFGGGKK